MTKLLEEAIDRLRGLPGDLEAIEEGRRQFVNGDYITFDASRGPARTR